MATLLNPNMPCALPAPAINTLTDVASGTVTYLCEAQPGALTSEAVWRVRRTTVTGGVTVVEFAGGGKFDQIAANRASLTYA